MEITSFNLSANKANLELEIIDAVDVSILRLWTDKTYKNFAEVIDLSAKLTGSYTETITITLSDVSEAYFDGLYFIEAKDTDETSSAITSELARFKECLMDKVLEFQTCDDCLTQENYSLLNAQASLQNLEYSIELKFPTESITLKKVLDAYCSNACRSCGDYSNVTTTTGAKDTLNPDTVIVKVDGGTLD